jgi:hypothetical protein
VDLYFGFGPVIRIRKLKPKAGRRTLTGRVGVETLSVLQVKHDQALDLLERRRRAWLDGVDDLTEIEKAIRSLGYEFQDEPSADDGRYSYWRKT